MVWWHAWRDGVVACLARWCGGMLGKMVWWHAWQDGEEGEGGLAECIWHDGWLALVDVHLICVCGFGICWRDVPCWFMMMFMMISRIWVVNERGYVKEK